MIIDEKSEEDIEHETGVFTCWSNVFEGLGLYLGPAGQDCVSVHESVCWRKDWRSLRSPGRGSSQSRWLRNHCGSDSGVYPPPHLLTLNGDRHKENNFSSKY